MCPSSAFIDPQAYELTAPADQSDYEFRKFVVDMATKYPTLKLSYQQLRECWDTYHGER